MSYDDMTIGGTMSQETFSRKPMKRETLADRVAADITQHILAGELEGKTALPTEPELAEQYGVSRSVIRDATRLLSARGLVDVRHGKGVFVTASQKESFADAFMLALRRDKATAWDAEEFSMRFMPVALSLATVNATAAEIHQIEELINVFLRLCKESNAHPEEEGVNNTLETTEQSLNHVYSALFAATHNKVIQHLAGPLQSIRKLRQMDLSQIPQGDMIEKAGNVDRLFFQTLVTCLKGRDPDATQRQLAPFMALPPEAISAMKETPIGESPRIIIQTPFAVPGIQEESDD
jgi:DNA-binding FadR family transcriptional regulator